VCLPKITLKIGLYILKLRAKTKIGLLFEAQCRPTGMLKSFDNCSERIKKRISVGLWVIFSVKLGVRPKK